MGKQWFIHRNRASRLLASVGIAALIFGGLSGPAAFADDQAPAEEPGIALVTEGQPPAEALPPAGQPPAEEPPAEELDPAEVLAPTDVADVDAEPAPEVAVQIERRTPAEQGVSKTFEYLVEFSCTSTRLDCTDVVIDVPLTQTTTLAADAIPMVEWKAALVSEDQSLIPDVSSWDIGKNPRQIVLAAPLSAGASGSVLVQLSPPNGRVANGTEWEILPTIRAAGADPSPAPAAATSRVTASGKLQMDDAVTVGGMLQSELHPGTQFDVRLRASVLGTPGSSSDQLWADLTKPFTISVQLPTDVEFVAFPEGSTDGSYDAATRTASWNVTQHRGEAKWITLRLADTAQAGAKPVLHSETSAFLIGESKPLAHTLDTTITVLSDDLLESVLSMNVETNGGTVGSSEDFIAPEGEADKPVTMTATLKAQHRATVSSLSLVMPCVDGTGRTCASPETYPTTPQSVAIEHPAGGSGDVEVVLTLADGSTETIQVGTDPVSLAPWGGQVTRVEAINLALPVAQPQSPPVASYTLTVVTTVPDDADIDSGTWLRVGAESTVTAADDPTEQISPKQTRANEFFIGALHAPIQAGPVIPGWSQGQTNVTLESFARWSAPEHERRDSAAIALLLPAGLEFSVGLWPGQAVERVPNYADTGRTLVRFPSMPGQRSGQVRVDTTSLAPGIYDYEVFHGFAGYESPSCTSMVTTDKLVPQALREGVPGVFVDGQSDDACHAVLPLVVTGNNTGQAITKSVRGDLDGQWHGVPGTVGVSGDGSGSAEYRIAWANTGPTDLSDVVVYDLLPGPNDSGSVGALAGLPRQSDFPVTFESVVVPEGFTAAYSVSDNPCRPELGGTPGSCIDDWSATQPDDPSQVRALRFTADAPEPGGSTVEFLISVALPEFGEAQAAMNSAAAGGVDPDGKDVPSVESPYVGVGSELRAPAFEASKTASKAEDEPLHPGDELEYTLTVRNAGPVTGELAFDDDLAALLDDATLTGPPTLSGNGNLTAVVVDGVLQLRGALEGGKSATVTYTVTVKADAGERGDDVLRNAVVPAGETAAETCEPDNDMCTVHTVEDVTFAKTADPKSGTEVAGGDTVSYTVTVVNRGKLGAEIALVDHLAGVLDDAKLVGEPAATGGDVTAGLEQSQLAITGALPAGETATVTYAAQVLADTPAGEPARSLDNFLLRAGSKVPAECAADSTTCTTHPIAEAGGGGETPNPDPTDPPTTPGTTPPAGGGELEASGGASPQQLVFAALAVALLGAAAVTMSVRRARRGIVAGATEE
ncbi:hypothetical protein ACI1US_01491 [Leucobacter sp. BZR 635]